MCNCTPLQSFSFRSYQFLRPNSPNQNVLSIRNPNLMPHPFKISINSPTSNNDFLELKNEDNEDDLSIQVKNEEESIARRRGGKRQLVKRSSLLAKQVISVDTAASLGFVSQLWVNTDSWMVVLVEVRPNLLSGDMENFLLQDVYQVGEVVLVEDESVMENELKTIGLDTLVGYKVMTTSRRSVGKVRGYTFNINSGAVEFLELDSFGVSVIPASLVTDLSASVKKGEPIIEIQLDIIYQVSTYCLFVEDVLDVTSDTITVHDVAASRVQRLTKGIWDSQYVDSNENYDFKRQRSRRRRKIRKSQGPSETNEDDGWDLPMDY